MKHFLKISLLLFAIIFLLSFNLSCNKKPTEPNGSTILLSLEDVSCLEAWIKITTEEVIGKEIILNRDGNEIRKFTLYGNDTLITDISLLPSRRYKYTAIVRENGKQVTMSNELSVTTMDTTSSNFTFETFTFGGTAGSSTLYDVAIINENNIWAVGKILVADTSINGYTTYNAVHWNGSQWNLKKITVNFRGNLITPPLEGAFAFSSTDIWFVGSLPIHGDGENWIMYDLRTTVDPNITVSKAWGSSSNDMYFVGRNGNIARYLNGTWSRIESGTDVDLRDVWGTTEVNEIFISGYTSDLSKSILLELKNNTTETIWENNTISGTPPYGNLIYSIDGYANNLFVSSNQGVFKHNFVKNYPSQKLFTVPRRVYKVAAKNINDIYTAGDRSNIWHYNGVTRKELYINLSAPSPFYAAAVRGDIFVAVGTTVENVIYHQATIIFLRRI